MAPKPGRMDGNAVPSLRLIGRIGQPSCGPPRHGHTVWEVVFYTSGNGAIEVGDQVCPIAPGTLLCLPPSIPHVERCPGGYTNYFLHIEGLHRGHVGTAPVPAFITAPDGALAHLLAALHQEFQLRSPGWQEETAAVLAGLLVHLRRRLAMGGHPAVGRLKQLLSDHLDQPSIHVGTLMAAAGLARDHLRRLFLAETGRTPARWIAEKRMEQAHRLLITGSYRVAEVAEMVGYPDPYHFSRVFRRVVGRPPSTVRTPLPT